jgi:hypothetical protein
MDVDVYEVHPDGSLQKIKTPGPDYRDVYSSCLVTSIEPPPGEEVTVPGTVTITVECTPPEPPAVPGG